MAFEIYETVWERRLMKFVRPRVVPAIACIVSVGLCLLYASNRSELSHWWNQYGGGVPYVLFWALLWFTAFPMRKYVLRITIGVIAFSCFLEVLQLWHPEFLAEFRRSRFGAALLGSTFVWNDFPPYFIGGALGYVVMLLVAKFNGSIETEKK